MIACAGQFTVDSDVGREIATLWNRSSNPGRFEIVIAQRNGGPRMSVDIWSCWSNEMTLKDLLKQISGLHPSVRVEERMLVPFETFEKFEAYRCAGFAGNRPSTFIHFHDVDNARDTGKVVSYWAVTGLSGKRMRMLGQNWDVGESGLDAMFDESSIDGPRYGSRRWDPVT